MPKLSIKKFSERHWVLFLGVVCCLGCASTHKVQHGEASWYGPGYGGKATASGEKFRQYKMTAAHKTLPLGTVVRVTHTSSGKSVRVTINDRGPYVDGRIIDLSKKAGKRLGILEAGVGPVTVKVVGCKERYGHCPQR